MPSSLRTIDELASEFKKTRRWREQNELLAQLEPQITRTTSYVLKDLIEHSASAFVRERIKGDLRSLEKARFLESEQDAGGLNMTSSTVAEAASQVLDVPINEDLGELPAEFSFDACDLTEGDRILLKSVIKFLNNDFVGVEMRALKPGFGGSGVYQVRPLIRLADGRLIARPKTWVAKLGPVLKLEEEFARAKDAATSTDSRVPVFDKDESRACLLQEVASTTMDSKTSPFASSIWPLGKKDSLMPIDGVCKLLDGINDRIRDWHKEKENREKPISEAFKIVLEQIKEERLQARLSTMRITGASPRLDTDRFGSDLFNPYWYLLELRKRNPSIECFLQPLHGDLHVDNIQVDSARKAHFIDWGNFGKGDSSLDYALLETSIWAHCLPQDFLLSEVLVGINGLPFPVEAQVNGDVNTSTHGDPMERCRLVILRIRLLAAEFLHEPKNFHYALGLFFCAVQRLQYDDANARAMLALAHTAIVRLEEDWGFIQ